MNEHQNIEKYLRNFELNKGSDKRKFYAKSLYLLKLLKINISSYIGPTNQEIEGEFYKNLPLLNLKEDHAFAQSFVEYFSISPLNLERKCFIEHHYLIKNNNKWEHDSKPIEIFRSITENNKISIEPFNEAAKENYNSETQKLLKWR
jgi:hypothetical protein